MLGYARYHEGLNDFKFCVSLHFSHPSANADSAFGDLGLSNDNAPIRGVLNRKIQSRFHGEFCWAWDLTPIDDENVPDFLERLIKLLMPLKFELQRLARDGGRMECFVGLFATRLCDQVFSHELMMSLAELKIDLRLDYYPSSESQDVNLEDSC